MRTMRKWFMCMGLMRSLSMGVPAISVAEMSKWNLDKDHTTLGFEVVHMVVSKTQGKFTEYSGTVEMDADKQEFKTFEAVIQTASVTTDHQKRDDHLRSADFFDATTFPTMTYKMKN